MEELTFLDHIMPVVIARTILVLVLVGACSLFFNAGLSSENFSQLVLIVLDFIRLPKWIRIGSQSNSSG